MAIIINFPSKDVRLKDKLIKKIDEMNFSSDELKNCVKEKVISVLDKHNKLPDYSFSIDLPFKVTEEQSNDISDQVAKEFNKYTKVIAQEMMMEICMLHVELCKLIQKINQQP